MSGMRVFFKGEDEDAAGQPVGPVTVCTAAELAEAGILGVPYDPNRVERWVTLAEARAVAMEHGVELERE